MKERINCNMGIMDMLLAVCGGNPGAAIVCAQLVRDGGAIDPDSAFGGLGSILNLDRLGIWESRIWMLYKDVCGQNLGKMVAMLRANQLGFLCAQELNHAIDNHGDGLDVDAMAAKVQERLPKFNLDGCIPA